MNYFKALSLMLFMCCFSLLNAQQQINPTVVVTNLDDAAISGLTNQDERKLFLSSDSNTLYVVDGAGTPKTIEGIASYVSGGFTSNTTITPITQNIWVQIFGTHVQYNAVNFTSDVSGNYTYIGASANTFVATVSVSAIKASPSISDFEFQLRLNGVDVVASLVAQALDDQDAEAFMLQAIIEDLMPNDIITIWARNTEDNDDLTVLDLNIIIH